MYSPANGISQWYSSTQSVELDNDTELNEPLDADAGDLFQSNLPEHLLYSYYGITSIIIIYIMFMFYVFTQKEKRTKEERERERETKGVFHE